MTEQTMQTWSGSPQYNREHFQAEIDNAKAERSFFEKLFSLIEEYGMEISNADDSVQFRRGSNRIYEFDTHNIQSFQQQIETIMKSVSFSAEYHMMQFIKLHGEINPTKV